MKKIFVRVKCDIAVNGYGMVEGELLTIRKYKSFTNPDKRFFEYVEIDDNNVYHAFGIRKPINKNKVRKLSEEEVNNMEGVK